uniref:DUF4585 domain-containing protein n=1 Tax=Oryzias latipes TaxID=8090 RepID=A0A3P9LMT6_ORYLA
KQRGNSSDTSSGGSFLDENDREVSSLTDRAFKSLCIGDEAVYNDSHLGLPSSSTHIDRQLAFAQDEPFRDEEEREELKRAAHQNFSLRVQQYGQDWVHEGMYGTSTHKDPEWGVYGDRTQGRVSATFQNSFVETSQQGMSLREEELSFISNGATELSLQHHRSRSRVSSLIRTFNSEVKRNGANMNDQFRGCNKETNWDKSALMNIHNEFSDFSSSYQQNLNSSSNFPSAGPFSCRDDNFYGSDMAAVAHMSHNSVSSFMRSSHNELSMSAQANCNSPFFIHSEFSPFKTPMYKELSLENQLQASAVEKRSESELAGHYPQRRRTQTLGTNKLPCQRPSTASPTVEMSRRVRDTISSVKALQQKIKVMSQQNISGGVITTQQESFRNHNLFQYGNNAAPNMVSSDISTTPFTISQLPSPSVTAHQEENTSGFQQHEASPQPVEHPPVRAESRGVTPDARLSSYKSRATSLLFNLKDNRKRVKSTYSPTKFKGLDKQEKNQQPLIQEPRETVIDVLDCLDPDIQFLQQENSRSTFMAANQYQNPALTLETQLERVNTEESKQHSAKLFSNATLTSSSTEHENKHLPPDLQNKETDIRDSSHGDDNLHIDSIAVRVVPAVTDNNKRNIVEKPLIADFPSSASSAAEKQQTAAYSSKANNEQCSEDVSSASSEHRMKETLENNLAVQHVLSSVRKLSDLLKMNSKVSNLNVVNETAEANAESNVELKELDYFQVQGQVETNNEAQNNCTTEKATAKKSELQDTPPNKTASIEDLPKDGKSEVFVFSVDHCLKKEDLMSKNPQDDSIKRNKLEAVDTPTSKLNTSSIEPCNNEGKVNVSQANHIGKNPSENPCSLSATDKENSRRFPQTKAEKVTIKPDVKPKSKDKTSTIPEISAIADYARLKVIVSEERELNTAQDFPPSKKEGFFPLIRSHHSRRPVFTTDPQGSSVKEKSSSTKPDVSVKLSKEPKATIFPITEREHQRTGIFKMGDKDKQEKMLLETDRTLLSRSVISNLSEDVESYATSAADVGDVRGLLDFERPESACSFSSDVSRSLGKPPVVPPKTEKALRRAQRLTSRRMKKELSKVSPAAPKTVPKAPSSSTLHHANHPTPVAQYHVESSCFSQSYPMTQRKVLQDLGSGQYYVVDVPVQVQTKTFFDPETGKYVQPHIQQTQLHQTKLQPQPFTQTPAAGKPFVLYQRYHSYPQNYQPTAITPVRRSRSSAPGSLQQNHESLSESKIYGNMVNEVEQNSVESCNSPERTPYMDTVIDTDKTHNSVKSTQNPMESASECGTKNQTENHETSFQYQGRDIITMSELEDFMEATEW